MTDPAAERQAPGVEHAATPASARSDAATRIDFRTLFELEGDYVARSLRRLGIRASDIEDATHEVFVAVHAHLADYDVSRPIRPWLFAFAYRVACNEKRRPHHRMDLRDELPDVPDARETADDLLEAAERRDLLLDALGALTPEKRAVVVRHDVDGVAVPEIATALSIPLNTAYSRLRVGREELTRAVHRLRERRERTGA
jgi:RNA polymerase sigma-70 factor, ECF subfamily